MTRKGFRFRNSLLENLSNMAEAPRNTQLPSGYEEEFVNEVEDDFLCLGTGQKV